VKWRIEPVKGAVITGSPVTDGRRIVLAIRRSSREQGQDAIVAVSDDEGRKGDIKK
jgi:hypothetical protein